MHGFLYKRMGILQRAVTLILRYESKFPKVKSLISTHSACPCKNYLPRCSQTPRELIYFVFFYLVGNVFFYLVGNKLPCTLSRKKKTAAHKYTYLDCIGSHKLICTFILTVYYADIYIHCNTSCTFGIYYYGNI